jgi:hypothetical protein
MADVSSLEWALPRHDRAGPGHAKAQSVAWGLPRDDSYAAASPSLSLGAPHTIAATGHAGRGFDPQLTGDPVDDAWDSRLAQASAVSAAALAGEERNFFAMGGSLDDDDTDEAPSALAPARSKSFSHAIFDRMGRPPEQTLTFSQGRFDIDEHLLSIERSLAADSLARAASSAAPQAPDGKLADFELLAEVASLSAQASELETAPDAREEQPDPQDAEEFDDTADEHEELESKAEPDDPNQAAEDDPEAGEAEAAEADAAEAEAASLAFTRYASPFYASGEHVMSGEGVYPKKLRVRPNSQVEFHYGDLIAMADLFDTWEAMCKADDAQLKEIRALLAQDYAHYAFKGDPSFKDSPGTRQWQDATRKEYTRLAKVNNKHFAPDVLFHKAPLMANAAATPNHKLAWEKHHHEAINRVRAMNLPAGANLADDLPLVINGFGDHFLTDAFSAGHLFNKDAIFRLFKANFYTGDKLTPRASDFFDAVALGSYKGRVASEFKKLEQTEKWHGIFRPNISDVGRFAQLLKAIAVDKDGRNEIGNLAAKALHDYLNEHGITVTNAAGEKPWKLTGDGHLSAETLKVMKRAVGQSVANILDPAIRSGPINLAAYSAKVWQHVPQLTAESAEWLRTLAPKFVHPASSELLVRAQEIITEEVDALIEELTTRPNPPLMRDN